MTDAQLVPYYLMSSYLYYEKNTQVLTDKEFDSVCKQLLIKWDSIKHPHKSLINKDNLQAQTGYNLKFPSIVKQSALEWKREEVNFEAEKEDNILDLFC
jgi:hypothetical protein